MRMPTIMIQFQNVSKIYPTRQGDVRALDDVSLEVDAGQYVAICGPSGCGKSTLLSLVGGLALPTKGTVRVGDFVVSEGTSAARAKFRATGVGYVFQMFHLLPFLSVIDNVLIAAPQAADKAARDYADHLLERLGLQGRRQHRPAQLSAGERQRVALARALLNRPQILLADEPTGNLDPKNAGLVLEQISQFHADGGTILLVTHEDQAAARAQSTILLEQGQLQQAAPT